MLGHQLLKRWRGKHEVKVTLRKNLSSYASAKLFDARCAFDNVDVRSEEALKQVIADFRPQSVINATGIVKQRPEATDSIASIEINALFPHKLALACRAADARVLHMSTDCVFSGARGGYSEDDAPDARDLYGRTKLLGELAGPHCVTLRTSIVGLELSRKAGLLEWFLAQRGSVRGYTHAIYSGFSTLEMARIIDSVLTEHPSLQGVHHVSSEPISKLELLRLVKAHFRLDTEIVPYDDFHCDRSLDSTRFRQLTGYAPPGWDSMVKELAADFHKAGTAE